ncbi:MAG: DNA primase [Clostridia bacterium]|nr:DNA primase [Clostridia bacterium]
MAVRLSDQFLEQLRDRTDIEELIGEYVQLKRAGRLSKGLCPFHSEKTPSFVVYPDTRSYYCFGCTKGGDAITFIRDIENLDYIEAVKFLADRAGLQMPDEQYDDSLIKKKKRMLELNKEAARFFHEFMKTPQGKPGLDYWLGRGLSPKTITHFGLGYAPDGWEFMNHMRDKGYSNQELFEADLARKNDKGNYYANFRNRVMTPIIDLHGNVLGFGGRVLDNTKPKYINTKDTFVYKKGLHLFALNFAKSANEDSLILCEGYMDVIALHQAGFTNAVAGLGTALTDEQVRLISHYCSKVYLSYDSDEAGRTALKRSIDKLSKTNLAIHPLVYTEAKDPDEIIKKFGPERWKAILSGAVNETEYKLALCKEGLDISTDDGRAKYLRKAVPVLVPLGAIEKDIYASRLSEETSVTKEAIMARVNSLSRQQSGRYNKTDFAELSKEMNRRKGTTVAKVEGQRGLKAEETLLVTLKNNPDFLKKIEGDLTPEDFVSDVCRHIYSVFCERINSGQSVELDFLSSELSGEEMSVLVRMQNSEFDVTNTLEEAKTCVKILKDERRKREQPKGADLTDEDLSNLFKKEKN